MDRTITTSDTLPLAIYPQTTPTGRPWVELVVTGDAALHLARAVTTRLHGNYLARSVSAASLTALVSGALTDAGLAITPAQADSLAAELQAAADRDALKAV